MIEEYMGLTKKEIRDYTKRFFELVKEFDTKKGKISREELKELNGLSDLVGMTTLSENTLEMARYYRDCCKMLLG